MPDASDPLFDDDAAPQDDAASIERRASGLLAAAFDNGGIDVFDTSDAARLTISKKAADRLVQLKLARFTDDGRTRVDVTNAGRYWALHGGYLAFLKEEPPSASSGGRSRNPELEALRFTYMKLRLNTFWLSFGLSIAGFIISMISLAVAWLSGQHFLTR